jgi:prevent-host-death family protein
MVITMASRKRTVSVAEAKQNLSELLGRVAFGGETVTILRRGKPMANLVPVQADEQPGHLGELRGWLEDDDPFFEQLERVVESRVTHAPRAYRAAKRRRRRP